jgi:hypothetical protein
MAVKPHLISNSASTEIPLVDGAGRKLAGKALVWNPVTNTDNVALRESSKDNPEAAGQTPGTGTKSTAALDYVIDTTAGEVVIPTGHAFQDTLDRTWTADATTTKAAATASVATVTLASTDTTTASAHFAKGTLICKTGEHITGPFWETDSAKTLPQATFGTVTERFTIDNDAQAVVIPAGTHVKKAAVATLWATDAESSTARATQSTAVLTLGFDTSAGVVTVPAGAAVKVAAVAGNWTIDAEAVAPAATYSTAVVEVVGTPGTVIAAGKRVKHAAASVYWALDSETTIPAEGFCDAAVTCTTIGAQTAAAGWLNTIHDAVAGWTGVEQEAAATVGVTSTPTISRTCTCAARGATAAAPGAIDTIVDAVAGWSSVTNPGAAVAGLPIVASVDLACTCEVRGAITAAAGTLDTLPTPVTGVSAVSNPGDAVPGLTTTPSTTVGVTCQTLGDVAALGTTLNTFVHPEDLEVGVTVSNAAPATPGVAAAYTGSINVTRAVVGADAALANTITDPSPNIVGLVSVTNPLAAVTGTDPEEGTTADVVIEPGTGHPFDGAIGHLEAKALGSGSIYVQLMTGADAAQENMRPGTQPVSGSVSLSRDVAAALVNDASCKDAASAPSTVADGFPLPSQGAKELIALACTITAAASGTVTGTLWYWNALATTAAWYPIRALTFGNPAAIAADTTQALGGIAEVTWPKGATRVYWQTTASTGTPSAARMTITA